MLKHSQFPFSLNLSDAWRSRTGRALNFHAVTGLKRWLPHLLMLGWFTGAWGGTLSDPTRPPPAWLAAQAEAQSTATVTQDASSGVQLILIGPSRKLAMIDGKVIKPGDSYNGSKVLTIKLDEVVVQDASKSLKLTPEIEKKVITSAPLGKTGSAAPKSKPSAKENGGNQ